MIVFLKRLFLLVLFLLAVPATWADEWPTIDDLYVGDVFKYPILDIRATQAAAGFRAVKFKQEEMEELSDDDLKELLEEDPIPVVAAPDGKFYQTDHHHQALAALKAGRNNAYYVLEKDYTRLGNMTAFWTRMKERKLVREFDENGKKITIPDDLPKSVRGLKDDPFRSLAWFVRKSGGYRKSSEEFAEFKWADFFRTRIEVGTTQATFNKAIKKAVKLAHSDEARSLPGWQKTNADCRDLLLIE